MSRDQCSMLVLLCESHLSLVVPWQGLAHVRGLRAGRLLWAAVCALAMLIIYSAYQSEISVGGFYMAGH